MASEIDVSVNGNSDYVALITVIMMSILDLATSLSLWVVVGFIRFILVKILFLKFLHSL